MIRWCLIAQTVLGLIIVIVLSSAISKLNLFFETAANLTGLGNFIPIRVPGSLAFLLITSLNSTLYTLVLCFDNRLAHPAWFPSNVLVLIAALYAVVLFLSALLPELPMVQGYSALSCTWTDYGSWREIFVPSVYSWSAAVDGACTQLIAVVALCWILCMTYVLLIFLYWRQRSTARVQVGHIERDHKIHETATYSS